MKSTTLVFCLASALLASSASAYSVDTHSAITEQAVRRSALNSRLQDLGASVGLLTVDSKISNGGFYVGPFLFEFERSAMDWIDDGVVLEDDSFVCGLEWCARFLRHFYNPTAPPGEEGYRYGPLSGQPSLPWGLEPAGNPLQDYSYHDAKEYMYQAVLAPTERERKRNLAALLRSTGHIIHLVQDLAQPQHTRNDSHGINSITSTGFEAYVNNHLSELPFGNYPVVNLEAPERYWITPDGKGLANYTNRGFITAGTNFTGYRTGNQLVILPNPGFSSPGGAGTSVDRKQITDLLGPPGPGQPLIGEIWFVENQVADSFRQVTETNPRASTFSIFDEDLASMGFNWTFSVNQFTYKSARELLIPRAVGYSVGMIDHIFRGKLTIGLPQSGTYAVVDHGSAQGFHELKATVTNDTQGEALGGGTLIAVAKYHRNGCYRPDLSGEFTQGADGRLIEPCPNYRSREESMSVATEHRLTLGSGQQVELTFSFDPPIPIDATDLYLQVVYRGPLMSEQTSRVEQDGVAVGMKDIAEPTYLTIFNATDVYGIPEETGVGFHFYRDIIDHITDYPAINRNGNNEYDPPEDLEIRGGNVRYDIHLRGIRVATVPALPEGRFLRLALLVDPHPFTFSVTAFGTRFDRVDTFEYSHRTAQLDHSAWRYLVTPAWQLRGTKQFSTLFYFDRLEEGADLFSMPGSRAEHGTIPFQVSVMPGVGLLSQEVEPPAASGVGSAPVPIALFPQ